VIESHRHSIPSALTGYVNAEDEATPLAVLTALVLLAGRWRFAVPRIGTWTRKHTGGEF